MRKPDRGAHLKVVPAPEPAMAPAIDLVADIGRAWRAMADAAIVCEQGVREVAAACASSMLGGSAAVVVERTGSGWLRAGGDFSGFDERLAAIPTAIAASGGIAELAGIGTFVAVRPGLAILTDRPRIEANLASALRSLANGFDLALTAATHSRVRLDAIDEIGSLQQIAKRILSASELDEVLFSITRETTRLLAADIGGVFLREADELVMRSCVGHETFDIDRLRMKRGQGLAGRVLETERPCKVDDYLASDVLNRDFHWLARDEHIHCALGAPLRSRDGVIGVLEVWRRRNVPFTDQDLQRITALADLTTIAIHNARLYESQKSALRQLTAANENLLRQNEFVKMSSQLQDDVIGALLEGGGAAAIARVVARHAEAEVALLGTEFEMLAGYPAAVADRVRPEQVGAASRGIPSYVNNATATVRSGEGWLCLRPIVAAGDRVGWVCMLVPKEPGDIQEVAIRQAAIASALLFLEQRAASQARSSALGALLWDLLDGTQAVRQVALERLAELRFDLRGPHRVVHGKIQGLADAAQREGWSMDVVERKQREVRAICERPPTSDLFKLTAARGDLIVAIVPALDAARMTHALRTLHDTISADVGLTTSWGVSAPCESPSLLPSAHIEARSAVQAVARLGMLKNPVVLHEHLGVLALVLNGPGTTDGRELRRFIDRILGPMFKYDSTHRGVLSKTIRAYLDNDCSLRQTAQQLFVHEKTVRYRLGHFEELTSLDLRRHRDRMAIDLALLMHEFAARCEENGGAKG